MLNPSALSIGTIALLVRILTIVQLDLAFSSPADTLELSRAETWENPFFLFILEVIGTKEVSFFM